MTHFPQGQLIYQYRSSHQTLSVLQEGTLRLLRVDEQAIQSACNLEAPYNLVLPYTQSMMGVFLFQLPPRNALILGLGGGDVVRFLHHYVPQIQLTAVDIDSKIFDVAKEYFMLPDSDLNLVCDDALHFLQTTQNTYDTIIIDIYSANELPSLLDSWEFYIRCQNQLSEDGVLALNIITEDAETFRSIVHKVRESFNYLSVCLKVPDYKNIIIFAFNKKPAQITRAGLQQNIKQLSNQYELDFNGIVEELFNTNPLENGELIL